MSGITDLRKFYLVMAFAWIVMGIATNLALGGDNGYWEVAKLMGGISFGAAGLNHLALRYFEREEIKNE